MPRDGRRILITGGGSGIGRALAIEAASRGNTVAVSGRKREALEATVLLLEGSGVASQVLRRFGIKINRARSELLGEVRARTNG